MRRRALGNKGIRYSLVVTDNQNGASGATTNATITVKYTLNNVETTLGTNYKNGGAFLIPNGATNITVTGSSITNYTPNVTVSDTTYTVTYKACKVTVAISGANGTVTLKDTTKNITLKSSNYSFTSYVSWGDRWSVTAATVSGYLTPTVSPSSGTANSSSTSVSVTYTQYYYVTGDVADLGLPSGTLWATKNLGASKDSGYGDYFTWGNVDIPSSGEYGSSSYYNDTPGATLTGSFTSGDATYDAATYRLGGNWRTPTSAELLELKTKCRWTATRKNGVYGYIVTGPASGGPSIFLPHTGWYSGYEYPDRGTSGRYWSTEYYDNYNASYFYCGIGMKTERKYIGLTIRPVQ